MKFKVNKDVLLKGIETIENVISAKITLPILSNFLIETQKDNLRLTATDLNIGISCVIPVDIQEQGAITIPIRRFSSIIRELSEDDLWLTAQKNNIVIIESKLCQFKIVGLPPEEFPKLPKFNNIEAIKLEQVSLKQTLNQTSFAVSLDETRHILNGVLFKIYQNNATFVATDGKRLAIVNKKLNQVINKDIHIIVPIKTIQELLRNLKDEGELSLVMGLNQVLFDFGNVVIISRLIGGEFPDYEQVIPPTAETKIKINREQFLLAMRRASLLTTPDYQAVKLEAFKEKLVISKSTPDVGELREELTIENTGKELMVGFNPNYLIDVLKNLTQETIEFELSGNENLGVIRNDGYIYIILPMRLG
jgi:DNA polymerase-3 subunit beta